jgi:hypothetical protein
MWWEALSEVGTFLAGLAALIGVSVGSKKTADWFTGIRSDFRPERATVETIRERRSFA